MAQDAYFRAGIAQDFALGQHVRISRAFRRACAGSNPGRLLSAKRTMMLEVEW